MELFSGSQPVRVEREADAGAQMPLRFFDRLPLRERTGQLLHVGKDCSSIRRLDVAAERGICLPQAAILIGLASTFGISIGKRLLGQEHDERAIAAADIHDRELLDRFRELETLGSDERRVVIRVIDAFLAEHACDHVILRGRR